MTDINGNGFPDIIIGGAGAVTVLLQNAASSGTFMAPTYYSVVPNANAATFINQIAIADVNGDKHPDIVVSNGPSQPLMNDVYPNVPGVLMQNAASPGTFDTLQNLP